MERVGGSPGQWKVLECDFIPVHPDSAGEEGSPCTIRGRGLQPVIVTLTLSDFSKKQD